MKFLGILLALLSIALFAGAFYVDLSVANYLLIPSPICLILAIIIELKTYKPDFKFIGSIEKNNNRKKEPLKEDENKNSESSSSNENKELSEIEKARMPVKGKPSGHREREEVKIEEFSFNSEPSLDWDEDFNFKKK